MQKEAPPQATDPWSHVERYYIIDSGESFHSEGYRSTTIKNYSLP